MIDRRSRVPRDGTTRACRIFAAVLVFLAVTAGLCLPLPTELWGQDGRFHAGNTLLLAEALASGDVLPRWLPEVNGGLGGPNFFYYAFFSYYPAAIGIAVGGFELLAALEASARLYFALGFMGTGLLGFRAGGLNGGLVAPILFALSPYAMVLLHGRFALPEYAALSLAPWVLLAIDRAIRAPHRGTELLASVLVALLLCSHNLALIVWVPFLLAYGMLSAGRIGRASIMGTLRIVAGGFLLGAFQLAPSVFELGWIDASRQLGAGSGFGDWALPASALFSNRPEEGFSARLVPGPLLLTAMLIGAVIVCIPRCSKRAGAVRSHKRGLFLELGLAWGALLLTTGVGVIVSAALPVLSYVQFPWRFLGPFSLFAALAGARLAAFLSRPLGVAVAIALFAVSWGGLLPSYGVSTAAESSIRSIHDIHEAVYTGDFENKYLPLGARLPLRPRVANVIVPDGVILSAVRESRNRLMVNLVSNRDAEVRVRRFWFPGWRATVDGRDVPVERDPLNGEILLRVGRGAHEIVLSRERRELVNLYAAVSLSTVAALLAGTITKSRWKHWTWGLPVLALATTFVVGSQSESGFAPSLDSRIELEADRVEGGVLEHGWSVVHYAEGTGDQREARTGFATTLNLGPGGSLRRGLAVWTAEFAPPHDREIVFECFGSALLLIDGRLVDDSKARVSPDGLKQVALRFGSPLSSGSASATSSGSHRIVVVASGIERGARARLVVRNTERGFLEPLPAAWLRPARNRGYLEIFDHEAEEARAEGD